MFLHQDSVNTWTNVQNIFSVRFLLVTVYVFENIVIMIPTWIDFLFIQLQWLTYVGFFHIGSVRACILIFAFDISVKWTYILETMMHRFPSIRQTVSSDLKKDIFFNLLAQTTGTCFNQKIYAPSSSLLQGKHLPFSPSPLRLNIFRLFVILLLTQLYRYTPEIFLFSTATFKYNYRPSSDK